MSQADITPEEYKDLRLRLDGFLTEGQTLNRRTLLNAMHTFIPKDPEVSVQVYTYEIAPLSYTNWHIHGGATFFLTLQGRFEGHFEEGVLVKGEIGDVYSEPIGRPHRGFNPHPTLPLLGVGIALTSPHIPSIIEVSPPKWAPKED